MTIEELKARIEASEADLRVLKNQLRDMMIAASPYKPEQIITDKNGDEAKVLHVIVQYGDAVPIVVYRKKNGEWGEREYTLNRWDLPKNVA